MADITLDTLRLFVNERLSAVAEDILAVFVRTMFQYQQEIDIQRRQLDSLNLNPDIKPHVSDFFPVCKEEASPEQQDRRPSLAQKEPKITEELEELLQWPEQGDTLTMTVQAVKTDEDHNGETEHTKPQVVVEYCGASEPSSHVQPLSLHCSDSDTEDSDEWEETRGSLNTHKAPETYVVETLPLNNLSQDLKSSKQTPHSRNYRWKRKRHVCTHCGKRFIRSATLKVHMTVHSTDKPLSCEVCGKTYALKLHLIGHMRAHKAENALSSCTVCGEEFTGSEHMKVHMITHTGEKHFNTKSGSRPELVKKEPLSCNVCGKIYTRNIHMTKHMRTHEVQNAFSCKVCGEEFTQSGHLKAHMKTHTPEKPLKKKTKKPFSCQVCGKKYARNIHMTRHMMTHVKAENAESSCTVSGKESAQSGHLKVHMLTHTGDKPFKCTICGRGFTVRKNLARHTWTHTREKPFHCTVCGKGYVEMCDLRKHLRRSSCGSGYGIQVYATNT